MPTYDYVCRHCGHRFEVIHGVHAEGPTHCPVCHKGGVRKAISAPSIVFKGSGWAKKDRSSTSRPAAAASASSDRSGSKSGDDGGSSGSSGSDGSDGSGSGSAVKTKPAASGSTTPAGGTAAD
jgi:putative FmdB family regulatory protein